MIKSNRGIVLMMVLSLLVLVTTITVLYLNTTASDFKITKKLTYSTKAFFLAESGMHKTLYKLREVPNYSGGEGLCTELMPLGEYEVYVGALNPLDNIRIVRSIGYFPRKSAADRAMKEITAMILCVAGLPTEFYDNAVFAGEDVELMGSSTINGDITYGESINPPETLNAQQFDGDFPMLDFEQLRGIAILQVKPNGENNLYTAANIANDKPFPTSFWFDEDNLIPNIVYVETDLTLRGNVGVLGGFYVVAGDVITDPSVESVDTTINGNGTIDGCVYTYGDFRINGGGNGLGITGGVWARDDVRLNGNATVSYNQTYMQSIDFMNIGVKPQLISWKETYEF